MSLYDHMIVLSREEYRNLKSGNKVENPSNQVNNIEVTNGGTILIGKKDDIPLEEINIPLSTSENKNSVTLNKPKTATNNLDRKNGGNNIERYMDKNIYPAPPAVQWSHPRGKNSYIEDALKNQRNIVRDPARREEIVEEQKKRMRSFIENRLDELNGVHKDKNRIDEAMSIGSIDDDDDIMDMEIDPISTKTATKRSKDSTVKKHKKQMRILPPSTPIKRHSDIEEYATAKKQDLHEELPNKLVHISPTEAQRASKRNINEDTYPNSEIRGQKRKNIDDLDTLQKYQEMENSKQNISSSIPYQKRKINDKLGGANKRQFLNSPYEYPTSSFPYHKRKKNDRLGGAKKIQFLNDPYEYPSSSFPYQKRKKNDRLGGAKKIQFLNDPYEYPSSTTPYQKRKKNVILKSTRKRQFLDNPYEYPTSIIPYQKRKINDKLGGPKKIQFLNDPYEYPSSSLPYQKRKNRDRLGGPKKIQFLNDPNEYPTSSFPYQKRKRDDNLGAANKYIGLDDSVDIPTIDEMREIWANEINDIQQ